MERLLVSFPHQEPSHPSLVELRLDATRDSIAHSTWIPLPSPNRRCYGIAIHGDSVFAVSSRYDNSSESFLTILDARTLSVRNDFLLEGVIDAHSLCVDGNSVLVVSTGTDEVVRFTLRSNTLADRSVVFAAGDARLDIHHLNSIASVRGRTLLTMFGRRTSKSWHSAVSGSVIDVGSGTHLQSDLLHPHSITRIASSYVVCESARGRTLSARSETLAVFGQYVRGLCQLGDGTLVVGASASRRSDEDSEGVLRNLEDEGEIVGSAALLLCNTDWTIARNLDLGAFGPEVYDVVRLDE